MDYTLYKAEDFAADESFVKYYLGTDPNAIAFWERWISLHPHMLDEIVTAEHLIDLMQVRLPEEELEQETQRLKAFLKQPDTAPVISFEADKYEAIPAANHRANISRMALALCCCLALAVGFIFFFQTKNTPAIASVEWLSSSNPVGQRSIIELSDGSKITLNAGSTLSYPKTFSDTLREVVLEGEAFFEIASNPEKPFVVRSGSLLTTVLGTKFNVKVLPDTGQIQVALVEGSVRVTGLERKEGVVLEPKQLLTFSEHDLTVTTSTFDEEELLAWRDGTLLFRHASFEEVAAKLHQTYGITLRNESQQQRWSYSGQFKQADYLTVVKSICFAKRLTYEVKQDTIIFR
jgi:transmembrane sensor